MSDLIHLLCCLSISLYVEASVVISSPFLFPESELVTEPEENQDTKEAEELEEDSAHRGVDCSSLADSKL